MKIDHWPWGDEKIIWGYMLSHKYTLKVLEPKLGRAGCLSLQKHRDKSESWVVLRGCAWVLVAVDGEVCSKLLRPFGVVNLPAGTLHRLAAVEEGTQVLEASTPDIHAADKTKLKDVIRLHCVHGRAVTEPGDTAERRVVERCIEVSEEALACIARGAPPPEVNTALWAKIIGWI